ncbi:hypothetical protein [Shewanella benthica]|uniref:Sodium-dependent transporter, putative n=1 Tax=Shewanella benthica KT99 TaxID=314608 RepID=A9CX11_9GAMM|nr:hypothetical protein [Shewanella benthica]EDQ02595.1 sodium-dependent transporter, putative [Shewanella benthica KT99]
MMRPHQKVRDKHEFHRQQAFQLKTRLHHGQHSNGPDKPLLIGFISIVTATLICTFYTILSGWFVSFALAPIAEIFGFSQIWDGDVLVGALGQTFFSLTIGLAL